MGVFLITTYKYGTQDPGHIFAVQVTLFPHFSLEAAASAILYNCFFDTLKHFLSNICSNVGIAISIRFSAGASLHGPFQTGMEAIFIVIVMFLVYLGVWVS